MRQCRSGPFLFSNLIPTDFQPEQMLPTATQMLNCVIGKPQYKAPTLGAVKRKDNKSGLQELLLLLLSIVRKGKFSKIGEASFKTSLGWGS